MAGVQGSSTSLSYPYGNISRVLAGREQQQIGPLLQAFGLGMGPNYGRFEGRLQNAQGPLADLARYVQGFTGAVPGEAQQIGQQTAARGEASYEALTNQINQSLAALPQYRPPGSKGSSTPSSSPSRRFPPWRSSRSSRRRRGTS